MGYSKNIIMKATKRLNERKNSALDIADYRKKEVYSKDERFQKIDEELGTIGSATAKAVLSGKTCSDQLNKLREKSLSLTNEYNDLLFKYGYTSDYLEPQFFCDKCNDTGYIETDNRTIMCDCLISLIKEEAAKELNSVSPLELSTFDNFDLSYYDNIEVDGKKAIDKMTKIYDYCIDYAKNFSLSSKNLLLQGSTGLGKTHLSLAIANEVIKKGFSVVYVTAPDISNKLQREHFSFSYNEESDTFSSLLSADLLIIDDLGTEFISQFSTTTLYNLFNSRILMGKPIIINTNLTLREIEQTYSQRFVSRIMGDCDRLDFVGKDIRAKL